MKKPVVKTKNPIKKCLTAIKSKYFPTPAQMVDAMKTSNSYPSGKAYWQIAPKIIKNGKLEPIDKVNLLLDLYGKYYIYQQQKCVNFAVYETYYEQFMIPQSDGTVFRNKGRYEKLYNEMLAENSYIINRDVKEGLDQIISQVAKSGTNKYDFVQTLDERAKSIVYLSSGLKDDFHDKQVFNVYIPSQDETYIKELLCERFFENHPDHLETFRQNSPFSEFSPEIKPHKAHIPTSAPTPVPTGYKEGIEVIKDIAQEVSRVTTTKDKLPEQ